MTTVLAPPETGTRVSPARARIEVPRVLHRVSLAVVVAGVVMGFLGAIRTGVSWDEPYHVMRLRNYLDHGWFGLDWSSNPSDAESNTMVYGPVAMLLLHGLGTLVGVEHWGSVSTSPAAYEVRHVGVLLIGLAGTAAAATITRILLGSWRWALVTAAVLLALPMWTGHLMFNIKDVPVATGYTFTTLALVAMVAPVQSSRLLRVSCLAAGIVLMVGTRPGMAVAVVVGLVVLAAGVLAAGRFGNARTASTEAGSGVVAAALVLLTIYPNVFRHPLSLVSSAERSANFRNGQDAVYGYVPFHVIAQVPLLLQAFFVIGLVFVARLSRSQWRTDTSQVTRYVLVTAQLFALPLVAIAKHSDLYNGLRQLLFASPAWAIIATVGLARAVAWSHQHHRLRLVSGVAAAALVLPVLDQLSLFPYQYTYYNVALDATGVHVPSDYWRVSLPELLGKIPTDGQIICSPTRSPSAIDPGQTVAGQFASDNSLDCRTDPIGPLASLWATRGLPLRSTLPHGTFYAIIDRDHPTPRNCTRLASVHRTRHGRVLTMTYVARCQAFLRKLGPAPVFFTRSPGNDLTPRQWAYAPQGWVARDTTTAIDSAGTTASLTFRLPAGCATTACELVLNADVPSDLVASVNDDGARPVGTTVPLPRGTRTAWITFTRSSGAPLGLRLHDVRVISKESAS